MHCVWVLRHGESTANVADRIVSDPAEGCARWGLSPRGRDQARSLPLDGLAGHPVVLVSSDFLRARETADLVARRLHGSVVTLDTRLRERNFGPLEGEPSTRYADAWARDAEGLTLDGVEAVPAVWERAYAAMEEARKRFPGHHIVLVAHGDILQILLAGSAGLPVHQHRTIPHLGNAELRLLRED